MSGDVALVDAGDGAVSRLVTTASTLFARPGFAPAALVGGLAVTIRLATVHRATNDVDTVSDGEGPRQLVLEYLGERDAATPGRIEVDGVKVDVMPTWPIVSAELPDDDLPRLFVVGHRWALETATLQTVDVVTSSGRVVESASLRVATAPALVACKLHAIADRRDARSEKRESDALDLVRLVGDLVRSRDAVDELVRAPFGLAAMVATQVEHWFIDNALRMARLARLGGAGEQLELADLEAAGTLFISALRGG